LNKDTAAFDSFGEAGCAGSPKEVLMGGASGAGADFCDSPPPHQQHGCNYE